MCMDGGVIFFSMFVLNVLMKIWFIVKKRLNINSIFGIQDYIIIVVEKFGRIIRGYDEVKK